MHNHIFLNREKIEVWN